LAGTCRKVNGIRLQRDLFPHSIDSLMNCSNHPESASMAICHTCMKPFCSNCLTQLGSEYFCTQCVVRRNDSKEIAVSSNLCKPGIAFGLGLIPGVGAICNGDYMKAFVYVALFFFLISIARSPDLDIFEPLFVLLTIAFYFYMPLEAYHTAKSRLLESKGLLIRRGEGAINSNRLWVGVFLIFIGMILFLNNVIHGFIRQIFQFWPVALIGFGCFKILSYLGKKKTGEEGK
jgi:cell wall-active antibiotic response 4TMS protein YvqF